MLTRYLRNITLFLLLTFSIGKVNAQEVQSDIDFLKEVQAALTKGVVHDAIKMMKDSVGINIYPAFHIADDSALWPYALELYFDVRIERKEPYVLVKLNLNPSTGKWTDFSSYSVSISLTQGQQKAVPTTVLVAAEKQLNEILANIGNLREYFGQVRDNIAQTIQKLRFAMMDKYFEGRNLPLVSFYPSSEQQFGFDYQMQQEIISKYKNFYRYDTIQRVPWKALSTTKPDKINAYIQVRDTSFSVSKIRFVNRSDVKLQPFTTKDDTLVFQLTGTSKDQDDEITAEYVDTDPKGKERKAPIGQVKTIAYQEETNIVHIVPVGVKYPATEKELEKFLNKVYNQAVTNWTVVFDKAIDVKNWDIDGDKILNIETSMFQRYSDEEQVFIDALEKANGSIDPKAAYMFITDVPNNLNARGYMPLSAQFGFIFLNGVTWDTQGEINLLNTAVAHELGHGIYKLKHPWDEYGTQESQTANLLDYQNGTLLWKPQWDWIHDPGVRLYMFQKVAEGTMKVTPKKGTPVVILSDTTISEGKVFVYNGPDKKMKVKFEISDTSKTKITYQLITLVESSNTTLNYPKTGHDTLIYNQVKEITLDSIPQGKYTLICKSGTTEFKITFHIRKMKMEITKEQLLKIFGDKKDTARYAEVARVINSYCEAYGITTTDRMAHFLGQIGAETGGLKKLKESASYSARAVAKTFPYPKYGHLFEEATLNKTTYEYNYGTIDYDENKCNGDEISRGNTIFSYTSISEVRNAYAEIKSDTLEVVLNGKKTKIPVYKTRTDVTKENIEDIVKDKNYNTGRLRVKSKYLNSSAIFDVTYACRMGNGNVASKDGSTFLGKGFIHITGKKGYEDISKEWNKLYPSDKKEFHGKDINLLETNVEIAIKASLVFWKLKGLNKIADEGTSPTVIEDIAAKVNGGDNGLNDRKKYTKKAVDNLK